MDRTESNYEVRKKSEKMEHCIKPTPSYINGYDWSLLSKSMAVVINGRGSRHTSLSENIRLAKLPFYRINKIKSLFKEKKSKKM